MTGKFRFAALWICGCVFSERALKEIKSKNCSMCHTPFNKWDIVILNGTEEEMDLMVAKMEARTARQKAAKKDKKAKKPIEATVATVTSDQGEQLSTSASIPDKPEVLPTKSSISSKNMHVKPFLKREACIDRSSYLKAERWSLQCG